MNDEKMMPMGGGPGGPGGPMGGPPNFSYVEKKPQTDWVLEESVSYPGGIVLYDGSLPVAGAGKALLMTVDGVPVNIQPGVYAGKVELTVYELAKVPKSQGDMSSGEFRTALYFMDGKEVPTGIEAPAGAYEVEGKTISGICMTTDIDDFNGIIVGAEEFDEEPLVIRDSVFCLNGGGSSEGKGSGINVVGKANVKIENVEFWDYGTLTAIMASGEAKVEVANSVIYGARDFTKGKLCPWVLGINGSNRLTNAIDRAKVHYHDSIVVAQSWAALSTDAGQGVRFVGENLFAGIGRLEEYDEDRADLYTAVPELGGEKYGFIMGNSAIGECGYINYADTGFHNSFRDVTFYSPDYIFILSTSDASIDVTGHSKLHSNRFGVLMHKNHGGTVLLKDGEAYAKDALFLIKGWAETDSDGCWPTCIVDGTKVTLGEGGVLYQLMTSDDVGLTPGGDSVFTVPEVEANLASVEKLPETYKAQKMKQGFPPHVKFPYYVVDGKEVVVEGDEQAFLAANPTAEPLIIDAPYRQTPAVFQLKNTAVEGDIYNGVYARIQVLDVTLDNAALTGRVSSAYTRHVDAKGVPCAPGTTYRKSGKEDEHLGIGRVGNVSAPAINNPVHLTMKNGAVWVPKGESYLEKLTLEAGCTVQGTVTVDGAVVSGPGTWEGTIVVTP